MDPVVALLLKNGVFGILAGVGFYLYFRERKINYEHYKAMLEQSVEDAAAKTRLALALEDLVVTIGTMEKNSREDLQKQRTDCRAELGEMRKRLEEHTVNERIEKARAEERERTLSQPFIRTGEKDEPNR